MGDYIETGIQLNSNISSELLINIFIPNTPLHDGAVIIQKIKSRLLHVIYPYRKVRLFPKSSEPDIGPL